MRRLKVGWGMHRILVVNHKGGCGKTTIATNLAAWFAAYGHATALVDFDPQGSSVRWHKIRGSDHKGVQCVNACEIPPGVTRSWHMRIQPFTEVVIVDSPSGIDRDLLVEQVRLADTIVVPVLPSPIDIHAATRCVQDLLITAKARSAGKRVGIVANRVRSRTIAFQELKRFLDRLAIPVVGILRDTQNYVHTAAAGAGVIEMDGSRFNHDIEQFANVARWAAPTLGRQNVASAS